MKITITNYDKTYSVETDEDMDVESMGDIFKSLLVSMGYHPCNVDELFNTEYKWFTQAEIDDNRQGHIKEKTEEWQNNLYRQDNKDNDYVF
jgi:hypothetical protein